MVIHAAKTGRDKSNNMAVMSTDQVYKLKRSIFKSLIRIFSIVVIKLIAPAMEETPARCRLNILKSTAGPECVNSELKGGYKVQPVPVPDSTIEDKSNKNKDIGSNQKLRLFNRGKAISGTPSIKGMNQLPNAPISMGITIKKIIIKAWAVTITL